MAWRRPVVHAVAHLRFGAGRYVVDAARRQAADGRHVSIIVSEDAEGDWKSDPRLLDELADAGIRVDVLFDFFHRDLRMLLKAGQQLRRLLGSLPAPAIVHAHTAMAAAVARWAGAPYVVATCHGHGAGRPEAFDLQDALAYRVCDAVTTPSAHWALRLAAEMGVKAAVVPVGLDLSRLPPPTRRSREPADPLRIVTVCELTERKGVDVLLDAMPGVWAHDDRVELHVIGDGADGSALRAMARDVDGSGSRIAFHGHVDEPYPMLGRFDLFALSSRADNLPVAIIEAMLAGLPIAATQVGGIAEMVESAACGAVVDPPSPQAVAAALVDLLARGRRDLERLGAAGARSARRCYSVDVTNAALEAIYDEIVRIRSSVRSSADCTEPMETAACVS